ncbi:hypothetical protein [Paenibacillus sp. FSL R10-2734]|uniref:hypothetical protein n=1 Tax=Paenibacillus sp. FSL R10-2734 TaxID=2954691 RepID=UPI0030D75B7E
MSTIELKRSVTTPVKIINYLYFAIGFLLIERFLFKGDGDTAYFVSLLIVSVILLIAYKWPAKPYIIFFGFLVLVFGKIYYGFSMDPIVGSDEIRYHAQMLAQINDFNGYLDYVKDKLTLNYSIYPSFGMFFMPFYYLFGSDNRMIIVIFNTVMLVSLAQFAFKANRSIIEEYSEINSKDKNLYTALIVFGVLASPSFMYWSSTFAKDITNICISFAALYLLIKKKYFWFIVVMFVATIFRPYTIVFTLGYYFIYKRSMKMMVLSVIGAIALVFYKTGITGLINTVFSAAYLVVAPFPFNYDNWVNYRLSSLESLLSIILTVVAILLFLSRKETRKFLMLCALCLYLYACVVTAVGHVALGNAGMNYGLGMVGDNMTRKKLPIIVLLYMVFSYCLTYMEGNRKAKSKA